MKINQKIIASLCALTITGFISTTVFAHASDSDITTAVQNSFKTVPAISGAVTVKTTNGVVDLTGTVKSKSDVSLAVEKAESTSGVKDVNSHLTVQGSKHPLADTVITAKIKGEFIREKLFGDKDLSVMHTMVETNNGSVTLTGNAETKAQIDNATKLAKQVNGVKNVKNKMKIKAASSRK